MASQTNENYKYVPDQRYNDSNKDYNALRVRLDTSDLISNIYTFLSGTKVIWEKDEEGKHIKKVLQTNDPLLNEKGVNNVMMTIQTIINTHMAQGNLEIAEYYRVMSDLHSSIADDLFVNKQTYNISTKNYNRLVDGIVIPIRIFLTRAIDNEERKSFFKTIMYGESNTVKTNESENRSWVPGIFRR